MWCLGHNYLDSSACSIYIPELLYQFARVSHRFALPQLKQMWLRVPIANMPLWALLNEQNHLMALWKTTFIYLWTFAGSPYLSVILAPWCGTFHIFSTERQYSCSRSPEYSRKMTRLTYTCLLAGEVHTNSRFQTFCSMVHILIKRRFEPNLEAGVSLVHKW